MYQSLKEKAQRAYKGTFEYIDGKLVEVLAVTTVAGTVLSPAANATGPDFTSLTTAVDFTTVIAAILLIAAAIAGVDIVISGSKKILAALKRG